MEREKWSIAWPIPITPAFKTKGTCSKVTDAQLQAPLISDRDVKRQTVTQKVLIDVPPSSSPPPPSQAPLTQPLATSAIYVATAAGDLARQSWDSHAQQWISGSAANVRVNPILFQVRDQAGEGTPLYDSTASLSDWVVRQENRVSCFSQRHCR